MNQGGALVEATLRAVDPNVSYKGVHASRGKITRAQPIASLTEQGRIHHVGNFPELEEQLCNYDGSGERADRLDAFVHAMTFLSEGEGVFDLLSWAKDLSPSPFVSSEPGSVTQSHSGRRTHSRFSPRRRPASAKSGASRSWSPQRSSRRDHRRCRSPAQPSAKCGSACTDRVDVQLFFCKMCFVSLRDGADDLSQRPK